MSRIERTQIYDEVSDWVVEREGEGFRGTITFKEGDFKEKLPKGLRSKPMGSYAEARNWCIGIIRIINGVDYN